MKHLPAATPPPPFGAPLQELSRLARDLRYQIVQLSHNAGTPHLGSALSCVDILVAAHWRILRADPARPNDPSRDKLILSKGHAATALYATLSARGYFPESLLDGYAGHGNPLGEHPAPHCAPGVELATGSLGHGLPVACGMALANRLSGVDANLFVVLSDGECNEGSVWEAALFAPAQSLGRLVAIVDYNKWQATGRSNEVLNLPSLVDKWKAFGWDAHEVDGHDLAALCELMGRERRDNSRPTALIAHTIKGRGVSFMEDDNNWHYRVPNAKEVEAAAKELAQP